MSFKRVSGRKRENTTTFSSRFWCRHADAQQMHGKISLHSSCAGTKWHHAKTYPTVSLVCFLVATFWPATRRRRHVMWSVFEISRRENTPNGSFRVSLRGGLSPFPPSSKESIHMLSPFRSETTLIRHSTHQPP